MAEGMLLTADKQGLVKEGEIYLKNKNQVIGKKLKKHYAVLYATSSTGVARFELYDTKKNYESGSYSFLIPGSEVVSVRENERNKNSSTEERYGFVVATKETPHYFYAMDYTDFGEWLKGFMNTLFPQTSPQPPVKEKITENDVYESADDFVREFPVTIGATASEKLRVKGDVRFLVESGFITLISREGHRVARWAVEHLRRFGYSNNDFHFEAGRKSDHGTGIFHFVTDQGNKIHNLVNKQKGLVKDQTRSAKARPHPGKIKPVDGTNVIPYSTGGRIYEEPIITSPTKTKSPPPKPSRQKPTTTLSNLPPVKSQPTKSMIQPPDGVNQAAPNSVYSEPIEHTEAWKEHGTNRENIYENLIMMDDDGGDYDTLSFNKTEPPKASQQKVVYEDVSFANPPQRVNKNETREPKTNYATIIDPGNGRCDNASSINPCEVIYATVDLTQKKNRRGREGSQITPMDVESFQDAKK